MKVAFDLDDTLIPTTAAFSCGASRAMFPFRLFLKEPLRNGASALLRRIAARHELWIYTTSLRTPLGIRLWLLVHGVRIHGVINADVHRRAVQGTPYRGLSKAPRIFGIAVLVDDAQGVAQECRQQGVKCISVSHTDDHWAERVAREIPM